MHILSTISQLADLPMYKELVRLFTTKEVFHFGDLEAQLKNEFRDLSFDAKETSLMLSTFHRWAV